MALETNEFAELLSSPEFRGNISGVLHHTATGGNESGFSVHKGSYGIQVSEPFLQDTYMTFGGRDLLFGFPDMNNSFWCRILRDKRFNPVPDEGEQQVGYRRDVVLDLHTHPTRDNWADDSLREHVLPSNADINCWVQDDQIVPHVIYAIGATKNNQGGVLFWRRNSGRVKQNKKYRNPLWRMDTERYLSRLASQGLNCLITRFDLETKEFVQDAEEIARSVTA